MITLKSKTEIEMLKKGGKILADVLRQVKKKAVAGASTAELDKLAEELIIMNGGVPSFKGYGDRSNPFPATLCISVNEQLVHGIPGDYILKNGDIVSLDVGMRYPAKNGLYTDMAVTVPVGVINKKTKQLLKVTRKALDIWIKEVKPGKTINQVSRKVQEYVEKEGFSVIRALVGHGVGHQVHEDPQLPNYFTPGNDITFKEGMVLCPEPMVAIGDWRVKTERDGWTISTCDKSLTAHFEHTIAVTKYGCLVITE